MHHTIVRQLAGVIAASIIAGANGAAVAADHPTKDEATAFVKKAIAHYKAVGRARAFSDISAPEGNKFVDGELYVAVTEISTGIAIANSTNQRFLGKVVIDMKDVDGKLYVKEQLDAGKAGKASWVDYRFPNPVTKQLGSKTTYCEPYDGFIFCTGIYRQDQSLRARIAERHAPGFSRLKHFLVAMPCYRHCDFFHTCARPTAGMSPTCSR